MARGLSGYIDALFDDRMQKYLRESFPINVGFLAEYPDFFSFIVVMILSVLLSIGVKESSILNNVFTVVNLMTVAVVIVTGIMKGIFSFVCC